MMAHEKTLLDLLGRALFCAEISVPEDTDFSLLFREAMAQGVPIIAYEALTEGERKKIPEDINLLWQKQCLKISIRNEQLLSEQEKVLELFRKNGILSVILKGSSSASCYPNPNLRVMGDIDILTEPSVQEKAIELLQKNGYGQVKEDEHHCHLTVKKGQFAIEVHNMPNGLHLVADSMVKNKFKDFFADILDFVIDDNETPVLSVKHQAVVLLLHKLEHFLSGGIGLRQLCDWVCFVDKKFTPELFLQLKPTLARLGLLEFCGIITRVCCEYLHLPYLKAPWCKEYERELCEEVLENILQSGNFGKKQDNYGQRYFVDTVSSNRIASFFRVLKASCYKHLPICKKHKILLCIAPPIIFVKYIKLRIKGERSAMHILKQYKAAGPRQKLYKSLKPFKGE